MLGVDGSGKTTLAMSYLEQLKIIGVPTTHVWSRYRNYLSKPFLGLMRLTGHNRKEVVDGIDIGFHDFSENSFIAYTFLMLQWLDQFIDIAFRFKGKRAYIVSDRCVVDTLVDLCVDTGLDDFILGRYGRSLIALMPGGTEYFIVNRSKKLIYDCRPDVKADSNYDRRVQLYLRVADTFDLTLLNNNGTIDSSIKQIAKQVG